MKPKISERMFAQLQGRVARLEALVFSTVPVDRVREVNAAYRAKPEPIVYDSDQDPIVDPDKLDQAMDAAVADVIDVTPEEKTALEAILPKVDISSRVHPAARINPFFPRK